MSLLFPWALGIAGLAAIPVVLHLLRHRTRQRVEFPALRYLDRTLREQARSVRMRDFVLLVVRVAALVVIAVAAAAPLAGRGDAEDHEPTDVALIVDNSASTSLVSNERTLLQVALEWARASVAAAGPDDRFWIFAVAGGPAAIAANRGEASAALDRIQQTHAAGNVLGSIRAAALALPTEPGRSREIQVLTDRQATGFEGEAIGALAFPVVIGSMPAHAPDGNAALVGVELVPGTIVTAGVPPELTASVWRFGPPAGDGDSAQIRLDVNGETTDIAATSWEGSSVFRLDASTPGSLGGRVEIEPSGLRVDDTRYFALRVLRAPDVERIVSQSGFLARALDALANAGRIGAGGLPLVAYEADSGRPLAPLPEQGSAVFLVAPSDPLELPRFNQYLTSLGSGWRLTVDAGRGVVGVNNLDAVPGLGSASVAIHYGLEDAAEGVSTAPGDSVLIRTTDGAPWLVRARRNGRNLLLLTSPLTPAATSLPIGPGMIPFVEAVALRWSRTQGWPGRDFLAGEPIDLPADASDVRLSNGTVRRVDGGAPFTPLLAGVYAVARAGQDSALFAVNPPVAESDLARIDARTLASRLGDEASLATDSETWGRAIYANRRGRDLTPWLLGIVALLLLSEIVLASPRAGARDARAATVPAP